MTNEEKLEKLLRDAAKLDKGVKEILSDTKDYDFSRLLKKVDAELLDLQHNLELARKLADRRRKER
ncbi:MAG: hypothetical protein OEV55_07710 [candidate division Zixibacteria bacterium]|nr:hypothetical protein [candidate division Zixibacteria bacterium]